MRLTVGELVLELTEEQEAEVREQLTAPRIKQVVNSEAEGMLDVAAVAERLGVSRDYVYAHARELGGEKLGTSPKAPWRFDPGRLASPGSASSARTQTGRGRPKPKKTRTTTPLLAVRGVAPYAADNKAAPGSASTPTEGLTTGGGSSNG